MLPSWTKIERNLPSLEYFYRVFTSFSRCFQIIAESVQKIDARPGFYLVLPSFERSFILIFNEKQQQQQQQQQQLY